MTTTAKAVSGTDRDRERGPEALLAALAERYGNRLKLASSLGAEDQVLTHMLLAIEPRARIFVLDTGRLHQETYDLMARTMSRYGMRYEVLFPDAAAVQEMVSGEGPNLFYASVAGRKRCCEVRKVEPLGRALAGADAWITGLRRAQSPERADTPAVEWDAAHGAVKANPLGGVERRAGVGLPARPRSALQRAARPRLPEHRLRPVHARRGTGRAGARRALVVGAGHRQGVRPASVGERPGSRRRRGARRGASAAGARGAARDAGCPSGAGEGFGLLPPGEAPTAGPADRAEEGRAPGGAERVRPARGVPRVPAAVHAVVDRQGQHRAAVAHAQGVLRRGAVPARAHRYLVQDSRDDRLPRPAGARLAAQPDLRREPRRPGRDSTPSRPAPSPASPAARR